MIFEFSQRCEIRRAPRAEVRESQKFFWNRKVYDKISLQIFLFGHNSKSEFFRAIWRLKFFFENSIFSKNFENLKILKNFNFFWIFHEKPQYSKASTAMNLKDIRILKIRRICRINQIISFWKNVWRARISWRAQVEYSTIERKNRRFWIFCARALLW